MPRFRKPPIIEAWLEFEFIANSGKKSWGEAEAQRFHAAVRSDFPNAEYLFQQEFSIESSGNGKPERISSHEPVLERVRMFRTDRTRCVQVGNDKLAFNLLLAGENYPGFHDLVNESLLQVANYRDVYGAGQISMVTLHYVDLIQIPATDGIVNLYDYFTIVKDPPEADFGLITGFSNSFVTRCPADDQPLSFSIAMLPNDDEFFRFRMDWHKPCSFVDFSDSGALKSSLSQTSDFMVHCFEKSITPKTRQLFDPNPT